MKRLRVYIHEQLAGHLVDTDGGVEFQFAPEYWTTSGRALLGRWFEDGERNQVYRGTGGHLPPWFDNLEPEGALAPYLANKYNIGDGPLELLASVGNGLPGAVRLVPDVPLELRPLIIIGGHANPATGSSLSGVQFKISGDLQKTGRLIQFVEGPRGEWILKIPLNKKPQHLAQNEHATMRWAARAGFEVPQTEHMSPTQLRIDTKYPFFAIRRFDRTPAGPVHQEDFAQISGLPPRAKYPRQAGHPALPAHLRERRAFVASHEGLMHIAHHLMGTDGARELLRRFVFEVVSGNGDAHLKNWSVTYPNRRTPQWSPMYDQLSTVVWGDSTLALPLFGQLGFRQVQPDHFVRLGAIAGLRQDWVHTTLSTTLDALRQAWDGDEYVDDHAHRIRAHWKKLPLTAGVGPLK